MFFVEELLRAAAAGKNLPSWHRLRLVAPSHVTSYPSQQRLLHCYRKLTDSFKHCQASHRFFSLGAEDDDGQATTGQRGPRNLILAVDRSKDSRYAVDWTIANICRPEGDIVHVVHVVGRQTPNLVGPDHSTAYMKFQNTPMNSVQEMKAERVRTKLAELYSDRMAAAGVLHDFHCLFQDGSRYDAGIGERICEIAEDKEARAVIVSAHRKSMLTEFLLGSTTNYLTHSCKRPVVVLHAPRARACGEDSKHQHVQKNELSRNLVIAVDSSTTGEALCKWTLNNIARAGDRVHALHVLPTMSRPHGLQAYAEALLGPSTTPSQTELQQLQHKKHTKLGQRLHALMPSDGSVSLSVHVVAEDSVGSVEAVASAICKHARHLNAAALVVSSGNKGDVQEWLMGSITTDIVHISDTPVLVVT